MQSLKKCKQNTYTNTHKEIVQRVCVCVRAQVWQSGKVVPFPWIYLFLSWGSIHPDLVSLLSLLFKEKRKCVSTRRLHIRDDFRSNAPRTIHSVFLLNFFFFGFRASVSHDRREGITLKRLKRKAVVADTQNISHKPSPARE